MAICLAHISPLPTPAPPDNNRGRKKKLLRPPAQKAKGQPPQALRCRPSPGPGSQVSLGMALAATGPVWTGKASPSFLLPVGGIVHD